MMAENKNQSINVIDIIRYLILHWKWYILSLVLFCGYYYYDYSTSAFVYAKHQTVLIKTANNTLSSSRITRPDNFFNAVNVNSEILQLKSKHLMRITILQLGANIDYKIKDGLRYNELYSSSPYFVEFLDSSSSAKSFDLQVIGPEDFVLSNFLGADKQLTLKAKLGKDIKTPIGPIRIKKNTSTAPAEKLKPYRGLLISVEYHPIESAVSSFISRLSISQMQDVALLTTSLQDGSASRASDVLSTLIDVYNRESLHEKNNVAAVTADFIKERLKIIEDDLSSVEQKLEGIKSSNYGLDISSAGQQYWSESREYLSNSKDIETTKNLVETIREKLVHADGDDLIPSNTGLVDASIESQIESYNNLVLRRNSYLDANSGSNPIVEELSASISAMHRNILRALDNVIAGYNIRIQNLRKEENDAISRAKNLPSQQRIMLSVERQQKVKEDLYIFLLNKREENAINSAMADDNIRVIDPVYGSDRPVAPAKFTKMALGGALGLLLPSIFFLFQLFLNNKVYSRKEIEDNISVPVITEIPLSRLRKKLANDILVAENAKDEMTEAFRIFRTNLDFLSAGEKKHKVIMFNSFNVGAGKTFSVINLGVSKTFLKKRVLVIDLDLRKGSLSARGQMPMPVGITHYLSDVDTQLDDIIYKDCFTSGMDLIPIGVVAPNPVELLLSRRLDHLIAELSGRYDYILIDSVPLGIVADASIVNRIADLSVFVIRSGRMDKRQLQAVQKLYDDHALNNMSILLNGVDFKDSKYGYGYGYGYGYSYGYGYGHGYGYDQKKKSFLKRVFSKFLGK